jgi:hypothetical protein
MPEPAACDLCRDTKDARPNRIGGVNLCHRCFDGGAEAAALARGFRLAVRCEILGHPDDPIYTTQGSASVRKPLFNASFRHKGFASLAGLFGLTIRVQDPLFHKLGVIITRDKSATHRFIDDDAAQSAVMDLLGESVSIVVKRTGQLQVSGGRKLEPYDQVVIEREMAVLLVHLDRYTHG